MRNDQTLRFAQVIPCTEAEGPGKRFAIWFQGCPLRCPGCCNPEFLSFQGGQETSVAEMTEWIRQTQIEQAIEGISLLGGEPFAHVEGSLMLARAAQQMNLSVMVYSGYVLHEIEKLPYPDIRELLSHIDILVDGPFIREQPEHHRRWIGSANQVVHFFTERYRPDDPCWTVKNTLEIRVRGSEITINGFPSTNTVELWKPSWKRKRMKDSPSPQDEAATNR